ncbi:MAG: DUF4351 domain-containing protein [Acidobacteriota bacterium]
METIRQYVGRMWNPQAVEAAAQEGLERGKEQAFVEMTLAQLDRKLGSLEAGLIEQVSQLPIEELRRLGVDLLDFQSRADLDNWLRQLQERGEPTEYKN